MKKGIKIGIIALLILILIAGTLFVVQNNKIKTKKFLTVEPFFPTPQLSEEYPLLTNPTTEIREGKRGKIEVGFYNKQNQTINVNITGTKEGKIYCTGANGDEYNIEIESSTKKIGSKESTEYETMISLSQEMEKQTYVCELAAQNVDTQEILATKQFFLKVI